MSLVHLIIWLSTDETLQNITVDECPLTHESVYFRDILNKLFSEED